MTIIAQPPDLTESESDEFTATQRTWLADHGYYVFALCMPYSGYQLYVVVDGASLTLKNCLDEPVKLMEKPEVLEYVAVATGSEPPDYTPEVDEDGDD